MGKITRQDSVAVDPRSVVDATRTAAIGRIELENEDGHIICEALDLLMFYGSQEHATRAQQLKPMFQALSRPSKVR